MLSKLYLQQGQRADEVLENAQLIYSACLKELIRQVQISNIIDFIIKQFFPIQIVVLLKVSLQCTERGLMIQKVWDAYLNLFEKLIETNSIEQRQLEKDYLNNVGRIQKWFNAENKVLKDDIDDLKQKLLQL